MKPISKRTAVAHASNLSKALIDHSAECRAHATRAAAGESRTYGAAGQLFSPEAMAAEWTRKAKRASLMAAGLLYGVQHGSVHDLSDVAAWLVHSAELPLDG